MLIINGESLTIENIASAIYQNEQISIDVISEDKLTKSFNFLKDFASTRYLYGINTGFGPMAQFKIEDSKLVELQYNLIRSHAAGFKPFISEIESRAILIARINSLVRGYSGVNPALIKFLVNIYNKGIIPCIPRHGGVGASGDLVQLAHLALCAIGEGEVYYNGEILLTSDVFEKEKILPIEFSLREGISIINGTSGMTGLSAINLHNSRCLINWMIVFSTMINEIMEAYDDHFSLPLNNAKKHKGQLKVASIMREIVKDSKAIRSRDNYWGKEQSEMFFSEKVQEYYSIRCIPQIIGPIFDTIEYSATVIENELNSTSDNPIIDIETENVYHGGNFHGDYISLEMDKIKLAITKLSMLSERHINYLVNNALNKKLPPFINLNTLGLNFGLQGMQFSSTSTTSENQTLSSSSYIHSIPNNNDNQDIVSMGFNAASIASKIIENAFEVLTVEAIAILQATDYLKIKDKLSSFNQQIYEELRNIFPVIYEDRATYTDQQHIKEFLMKKSPKFEE